MSVLNQSGEEQVEYPLCMEPLEVDDLNFFPCTCGYQISSDDPNRITSYLEKTSPEFPLLKAIQIPYRIDLAENMKYLFVFLLGAVCVHQNSALLGIGDKWPLNSLKAKYSLNPFSGYFNLPKTLKENKKEYVQIDEATANLGVPATLWCRPNDPRVCLIFDKKGNNIGTQISFLDQDTKDVKGYDYSVQNTYERTNIFNISANSLRVYYTNPEKLTEAGRTSTKEVIDDVYVKLKGVWEVLPREDPKVGQSGNFYRQSCFPQMGQHYFYKMTAKINDCSDAVSFFGIYHNGGLIGWGIATYGKPSVAKGGRDWYETVPLLGVKMIMPDRPSCVDDLVNQNGLYSMHTYFVDTPYLIGCLFQ
ncbi:hypothetical protein GE061_011872 [Apolygus lucorum]|uniref:Uncharacterized protein n=1 Tax=Apolygus lucorum TaxID=248454 RepID=A0A8S9XQR0_APOLU|nr:hypothetical protein GE061_011872 [Apolygus lucorum]